MTPITISNRGRAYAGTGDYDRAIADFDAAAKLAPVNNRKFSPPLLSAAAIVALSAWLWVSGCSKTPERETVPETPDTLSEITWQKSAPETVSETTPEIIDTLSETHNTSSAPVAYDTFTDTRDGKTYKAAKIGRQTWMAENLNYKPKNGNSWCYNDSDSCCEKYGRLYDWETAKKACPTGWHLSTDEEWRVLIDVVDDYKITGSSIAGRTLKATTGWNYNGTNDYGFSALPGGSRDSGGRYEYGGSHGFWWTATESSAFKCCAVYWYTDYFDIDHITSNDGMSKKDGASARCIR
jgi:uncharacterized protein (TIGR02145 family)